MPISIFSHFLTLRWSKYGKSSPETGTCLSYIVNNIAADGIVTQAAGRAQIQDGRQKFWVLLARIFGAADSPIYHHGPFYWHGLT